MCAARTAVAKSKSFADYAASLLFSSSAACRSRSASGGIVSCLSPVLRYTWTDDATVHVALSRFPRVSANALLLHIHDRAKRHPRSDNHGSAGRVDYRRPFLRCKRATFTALVSNSPCTFRVTLKSFPKSPEKLTVQLVLAVRVYCLWCSLNVVTTVRSP